jgi:tight adherence protein B
MKADQVNMKREHALFKQGRRLAGRMAAGKAAGAEGGSAIRKTGLTDYRTYRLTRGEFMLSLLAGALVLLLIGLVFYRHVLFAALLVPAAFFYPRLRQRSRREKLQRELSLQFRQALYSLSSSLAAGRSVENAFREAVRDLMMLYPYRDAPIVRELAAISSRLDNGEPIERCIADLAERAGLAEIADFADVFITCKRTGGDLVQVMRRTSQLIGERIEMEQDIAVMIAQKRFEANLLIVMPLLLVGLLQISAPDYMAPLYEGAGYLIVTAALLSLAGSCLLIRKIMDIKV